MTVTDPSPHEAPLPRKALPPRREDRRLEGVAYLRAVERLEELPCNRPGADQSWVLRRSKESAGRPKDLLFLETHRKMLEHLERRER